MNKKGIIAALVIIVLAIVAVRAFKGGDMTVSSTSTSTPSTATSSVEVPAGVTKDTYAPVTKDSTDTTLLGRLKKTSVGVSEDGTRIALSNGKATFTVPGTNTTGSATLGDIAVEKAEGSRKDVLASLAVNNGGSATYSYVVLFQDGGSTLSDKSYAVVGENVTITGVRADDVSDATIEYIVSVSYKDRSGAARTKILVVEGGVFNPAKELSL